MADKLIAGIDVGTSKIASIIAKTSEEESEPRILGFASVASRGVRKGQIVDINQVTSSIEESIEKAERMAGSKIDAAFVSIGGPHVESLNSHGVVAIASPESEISTEDVERAVDAARAISLSSTREIIEVIPREYIVDSQGGIKNPIGMSGVRLEVDTHIITASLTNLRNLDRCLSDLGIRIEGYVFAGLASSLAAVSDTEKELGVVLADIGGGKIDICVYVEGALSHSSSIPMGARHVTNDIAVGLRLSLDSAERLKLFLSTGEHKQKKSDDKNSGKKDEVDITSLHLPEGMTHVSSGTLHDGIIRPRLEEIFELMVREVEERELETSVPSGFVITGGGALTSDLVEIGKAATGTSVRVGTPQGVSGLVDEVLYPNFASVVGLLLYGQENALQQGRMNLKDFDKIFRNLSFKGSFRKVTDLIKSFVP